MEMLSLSTREDFDAVMRLYTPMVYRIAYTRLGSRSDAEDVTQDVFVRYLKTDLQYESEEHRKAWLIRCAVNCVNSFASSAWFRHRASGKDIESLSDDEQLSEDTTAEFSEKNDRRNAVLSAVMRLPPKYRIVVHLFYFEDMSVAEIGKATKTKQSTVKSQLSRARSMLRDLLEGVEL